MEHAHAWFVKTENERLGPVSMGLLQSWAASGAVNGETEIAETPEGPWRSASTVADLELDWQVIDGDGNTYFPCHILALRAEVEDGSVNPFWEIRNLSTGETYQVVDALCSALLIQNQILEEKLAASSRGQVAALPEDAPPLSALLRARDAFERDAAKWKRLYDDEISRNHTREVELQQQIEELRGWQRKASERIKALERRRTQLEEIALKPRMDAAGPGSDPDLKNAYGELNVQMDRLLESLELRTRQADQAREQSQELEIRLRTEREEAAALRLREQETLNETLRQLGRLEQAHSDLTRSYRNLNDKMVRLRNQLAEPAHTALPRQAPAPGIPAPATATPAAIPPPPPGRIKIKLT